jgi:hypothetical protein
MSHVKNGKHLGGGSSPPGKTSARIPATQNANVKVRKNAAAIVFMRTPYFAKPKMSNTTRCCFG